MVPIIVWLGLGIAGIGLALPAENVSTTNVPKQPTPPPDEAPPSKPVTEEQPK